MPLITNTGTAFQIIDDVLDYEGQVEEAFDSINDSYLKFNLQENGVKSYGMMVDLMLAYYDIQPDQ